jgi:hypothetical protein
MSPAYPDLAGSKDYLDPVHRRFPEGGYGELYCPWCVSTLVTLPGLDPQDAAKGHMREQAHTGRPTRVNQALRLADLSRLDLKD